jgi:hypothetical protein
VRGIIFMKNDEMVCFFEEGNGNCDEKVVGV